MENLGEPVAYLVLGRDLPVYDPDGRPVGHVAQVLADEAEDIFHGLVIGLPGIPNRHRFADPSQLAGLYERGVTLSVSADRLHEPAEDPVAAAAGAPIGTGLRRAWEWLNRPI